MYVIPGLDMLVRREYEHGQESSVGTAYCLLPVSTLPLLWNGWEVEKILHLFQWVSIFRIETHMILYTAEYKYI